MLFICYTFFEEDGVAAFRSKGLTRFFSYKGENVQVINKKTFFNKQINYKIWTFMVFWKILFSRQKEIYISCGPFTHLPSVYLAVLLTGKHLIIDFRDPWSLNIRTNYGNGGKYNVFNYALAQSIEKIGYKLCKHFLVCTHGVYEEYKEIFSDSKKLFVMENGYDFNSDQFKLNSITNDSTIKAVCLGQFADYNYLKAKKALNNLCELADKLNKDVEITLVGSKYDLNEKLLKECNLWDKSKILPRMPYKEAMEIAGNNNCALIVIRDEKIDYGTKIYDYIALKLLVIDNFDEKSAFRSQFFDYIFDTSFKKKESNFENIEFFSRNHQYALFYKKLRNVVGG